MKNFFWILIVLGSIGSVQFIDKDVYVVHPDGRAPFETTRSS